MAAASHFIQFSDHFLYSLLLFSNLQFRRSFQVLIMKQGLPTLLNLSPPNFLWTRPTKSPTDENALVGLLYNAIGFFQTWLAAWTLHHRCSLLLWRQWESLIVLDPAIDQTAYIDAWKKYHKIACRNVPEDEHLDVRNMSKTL